MEKCLANYTFSPPIELCFEKCIFLVCHGDVFGKLHIFSANWIVRLNRMEEIMGDAGFRPGAAKSHPVLWWGGERFLWKSFQILSFSHPIQNIKRWSNIWVVQQNVTWSYGGRIGFFESFDPNKCQVFSVFYSSNRELKKVMISYYQCIWAIYIYVGCPAKGWQTRLNVFDHPNNKEILQNNVLYIGCPAKGWLAVHKRGLSRL